MWLALWLPFACAAASPFSEADRALFEQAKTPPVATEVANRAYARAYEFGKEGNLEVLDYLIASGNLQVLRRFASVTREKPSPFDAQLEERITRHFQNEEVAATLMAGVRTVQTPELFALMYRDVADLAKWRADRRKRCRTQIVGVAEGVDAGTYDHRGIVLRPNRERLRIALSNRGSVEWRYVCGSGEVDRNFETIDALPQARDTRRRDYESLRAITRTALPGVEARLASLFGDLTRFPREDWSVFPGGKPPGIRLNKTPQIPWNFVDFFRARRHSPGNTALLEILEGYEHPGIVKASESDSRGHVRDLLRLLMLGETRQGTLVTARWIERLSAVEDPRNREDGLNELIPLLGPLLPEAQVDLGPVKRTVFENLPYSSLARYTEMFRYVEVQNLSLREPSADSLAFWMQSPQHAERFVPYLLAHGADPNQPTRSNLPPPLLIATRIDVRSVTRLLDKGARVDIRASDGSTALHAAASLGADQKEHPEIVALLVARGADVNASSQHGGTPLHSAAAAPSPQSMKLLLAAGAKIEAPAWLGRTPLFQSASAGRLETARVLLDAGADPNAKDTQGESPYSESLSRGWVEVTALLAKHGGRLSPQQEAKRAAQNNPVNKLKGLIEWVK